MPARQRGVIVKRGPGSWQVKWYDENGVRRSQGGFATKSEAGDWLDRKLDEVQALRRGDRVPVSHRPRTIDELLDLFLEKHGRTVDPATLRTNTARLRRAREAFGDRHPDSLNRLELEDWRSGQSAGVQHYNFRAFRQALAWARARGLTDRDATAGISNPKPKRHERRPIIPFESWEEVEAVAEELDPRYAAIPIFAVGTGLRPEEWIGLERGDIDVEKRLVYVRRRSTRDGIKEGGKTAGSVRAVPLRQRVLDALDAMAPRIDTRILFPAPRGGYIDLEKFRHREWTPALRAAGLAIRGPYTMRHTFATWAIEEGSIPLPQVATIMGTSIRELEDTYHRWLQRTDERILSALDAYDAAAAG
jgi:integrase